MLSFVSKMEAWRSSRTCVRIPSIVVKRPPRVPGSTLRLSSGHCIAQDSDFRISLLRSSAFSTDNVIRRPFSGTAPPVLTSLLLSTSKC